MSLFSDFNGTISYCHTPSGDILGSTALAQYTFSGKEHTFPLKCHGKLQRNKEPYQRRKESTRNVLRSNLQQSMPKEAFQKTTSDLRGTMQAYSTSQTPRNRKQAYNMKQTKKACLQHSQSNDVLGSLFKNGKRRKVG